MKNIFKFVETRINIDEFLKNTKNKYKVVSQRPYLDSNGKAGKKGCTFTLLILHDETDYGIDSKTGIPRDNNVFETFDVTVLNDVLYYDDLKKGDHVRLLNFIPEKSFAIDFNWILRFEGIEKIGGKEINVQ